MSPPDRDGAPDPPSERLATWKLLAGVVGVLGLLLVGSLIGSSHERTLDHPTAAPTATITEAVVRTAPAVTVTATPPGTTAEAAELNPIPLVAFGTGSKRTEDFTTNDASFEAVYRYDCSEATSPARFAATLYRNGDNVGPIVDSRRVSARGWAELGNGVGTFYVVVDTPCSWTVVILQGVIPGYH